MAEITALLETRAFLVGRFRCPPVDRRWTSLNWIGTHHLLAFPRRAVVIERSRHRRVVANANHVVLYDPDETYRRELLAPEGDDSLFIDVRPDAASLLVPVRPSGDHSFRRIEAPVPDRVVLRLHELELRLDGDRSGLDPLAVDELLGAIVASLAVAEDRDRQPRPTTAGVERRRLVEETQAYLSTGYAESLTLPEIGRVVGASPFHLARTFRRATGSTLHGYRERLRLREGLRRLRDGESDLAALALELGFSSHSHFDDRFRNAFGVAPSAERLGGGSKRARFRKSRTDIAT